MALAVLTAWLCHRIHAPCAAPSPAFAEAGDGNAMSQSKHGRFHGSPTPLSRGADFRLDVALPALAEGLRAELGELLGVGAAGRVPLHDAPDRKGRNMLMINNKMGFMNFRSYTQTIVGDNPESRVQ